MSQMPPKINEPGTGTIAPLQNVALFTDLVQRVVNRPRHLPGLAIFHGFSGYGKTFSATYAANRHRAYYLEVGESWTKRKFCVALLTELGLSPAGTIADMVDQIIEQLVITDRPLIIDEADFIVSRGYHETIREVHDKSGAPIVLIGEEMLPVKLQRFERFHNRVIDWVAAQPADLDDAQALAALYSPDVAIGRDLLELIVTRSDGRVRRICTNIERVRSEARLRGADSIDRAAWGDRPLFTGKPPARRS